MPKNEVISLEDMHIHRRRIVELCEERGVFKSSICEAMGVAKNYFSDKKQTKSSIPDWRLEIAAEKLNTTVEYLKGETDDAGQKNIPPSEENGMLAMFQEKFKQLSPENQVLGMAYILKLKESQDKQTD